MRLQLLCGSHSVKPWKGEHRISRRSVLQPLLLALLVAIGVALGRSLGPSPAAGAESCDNLKCGGLDKCSVSFPGWTCDESNPICFHGPCWEKGPAATPQVLLLVRNLRVNRAGEPTIEENLLVGRVGLTETETWLARGMPTPLIQ